jgi:hypothetical protein
LGTITDLRPLCIRTPTYLSQLPLEKSLKKALERCGAENIDAAEGRFFVFDLSESYWHDLGALLWLITVLHRLKTKANDVQLIFPEPIDTKGEKLWDFLIRWQFFDALSRCVDEPANLLHPSQVAYMKRESQYARASAKDEFGNDMVLHTLRLLEIATILVRSKDVDELEKQQGEFDKLEGRIIIGALSHMCGWEPAATRTFMQRVIREGIHNSLLHADGSFVNLAIRIDEKNLTLAISDNGRGIPQVLRTAFMTSGRHKHLASSSDVDLIKYFTDSDMILDSKLIKFSTEEGTTSSPGRAGVGLYYLKSHVLREGGELRIRSGRACVDFTSNDEKEVDELLLSPGTMLRIQTPLRLR